MTTLREAAQQALEALQNCANGEDDVLLTRDALAALRAALAEDVATHGSAWSKNGKRIDPMSVYAEPVQEQPVCDECGKHKRDGWALYCVDCVEPVFALSQPPDSKHAKEKA